MNFTFQRCNQNKIKVSYMAMYCTYMLQFLKLSTLSQGSMTTKREKKADAKKVRVVQYIPNEEIF